LESQGWVISKQLNDNLTTVFHFAFDRKQSAIYRVMLTCDSSQY
jgi:hypothetical protein